MKFLPLIAVVTSAWASTAQARDLQSLSLGTSQTAVAQSLQQSGLALVPVSTSAATSRAVFLLGTDAPAQLEFCRGVLVRVTETIDGGLQGFLARTEAETRRLGLPLPHLEQEAGRGEITFSEWNLPAGGHLAVAWTADADGALGTVTRDRPCEPAQADPAVASVKPSGPGKPAIASNPASPGRPAPSAAKAVVAAPSPAAPAAVAVDVKVPLPDVDPSLVVNEVVARPTAPVAAGPASPGPAAAPVIPALPRREAAHPEPKPPARSAAIRPESPAAHAVGQSSGSQAPLTPAPGAQAPAGDTTAAVRRQTPGGAAAAIQPRARAMRPAAAILPARRPEPVPADPGEPPEANVTNAIGSVEPAPPPDGEVESSDGGTAALPARRGGQNLASARTWRPATREQCAKAFKSYNAKTGTYRTVTGQTLSCP